MADFDTVIRGGMIYDGTGDPAFEGDIGIVGDTIADMNMPGTLSGRTVIDADGLAVAPGFINMLSWATQSLIVDGKSQSDIRQGVTLEVMGEGESMGPLNEAMKQEAQGILTNSDIEYEVEWTTLAEYLQYLERRGVAPNVASFVGAGTLRIYTMGYDNRPASDDEMAQMKQLLHHEMQQGAMGLSAALIYPPQTYFSTEEIIDLSRVVREYGGLYISHIRNEGSAILEALDEFFQIVEESRVRGEIYHLKVAGARNHDKLDEVIRRIEAKRARGLPITADVYPYNASGTGLNACIPPWAHEGGHDALINRLKNPETRERIKAEMQSPATKWENMFDANRASNMMLAGFSKETMRTQYQGKRLSDVAEMRGTDPVETLMDLIVEDDSRIFTIYFTMSEENVMKKIMLPWVSFCSDAGSLAPEPPFIGFNVHPRSYGSFARILGHYVRDEGLISMEEAIRRLTGFPAGVLKIDHERGILLPGYYADLAIFDPAAIQDHATFENPHQYATGMVHVFVNGTQVLRDGEHTGATPGRVVRGPGWRG